MAFCIECGAKIPDQAKFCPQCGTPVAPVEAAKSKAPAKKKATSKAKAKVADAPIKTEEVAIPEAIKVVEPAVAAVEAVDAAPSVESSLAASAEAVTDAPKSKAGLLIGIAVLALAAAGGGAYALGLFGGGDSETSQQAVKPAISSTPTAPAKSDDVSVKEDSETLSPVQKAYRNAISTGRISDLGEFAKTYPESSLAKDAETAAYASLNRQKSVLAFKAFTQQFPNADTSSYDGPRLNADVQIDGNEPAVETDAGTTEIQAAGASVNETAPAEAISTIRYTITTRATELDTFIELGEIDYVLSVIDEMLSLQDLNQEEATYLLNLRAKAETARGLDVSGAAAPSQDFNTASPVSVTPEPAPFVQPAEAAPIVQAEEPAPIVQTIEPAPLFDTPAKPVERFGAITPDEATEPGECDVTFSVNTTGVPTNISPNCTQPMFIAPAKEAVTDWLYTPASLNGVAVQQDGIVVKLKFHLE